MARSSKNVEFKAVGFEALAIGQVPADVRHPYESLAADASGFDFWWKLLNYAVQLPDPKTAPPLPIALRSSTFEMVSRFISASRELAESDILNKNQEVTVNYSEQAGWEIKEEYSPKEVRRGFTALFRQFYINDDASFLRVRKAVERLNHETDDLHRQERSVQLKRWRVAEGVLRSTGARATAGQKLESRGLMPPDTTPNLDGPSPHELIETFNCGDLIHWGAQRRALATYGEDPMTQARRAHGFLDGVAALCHFYMGFGAYLSTLFPQAT